MHPERTIGSMTVATGEFTKNGRTNRFVVLRGFQESGINELALYRQDNSDQAKPEGFIVNSHLKSVEDAWQYLISQGYERTS